MRLGIDGFSNYPRRIEAGILFKHDQNDDQFYEFHVETLLDQADALLARSLQIRGEYDSLYANATNELLLLSEFEKNDNILKKEEDKGLYSTDKERAVADYNASVAQQKLLDDTSTLLEETKSYINSQASKNILAAEKQAWAASLPATYTGNGQDVHYTTYDWYGERGQAQDLSRFAAKITATFNQALAEKDSALRAKTQELSKKVEEARQIGLKYMKDWQTENVEFKRMRDEVRREMHLLRKQAFISSDGALNTTKRLPSLILLFQRDYRDAYARLVAASKIIGASYGFTDALPNDQIDLDHFEKCLLWTRNAIQHITRFAQRDQTSSFSVSLRRLLGDEKFTTGMNARSIQFEIREDHQFKELFSVRLRGLSVFVETSKAAGSVWQMAMKAPSESHWTWRDGSQPTLDQSRVPKVWASRVTHRQHPRDPDVYGSSSLHNVSPIGQWSILNIDSIGAEDTSVIEDIVIDFNCAYRQDL